MLHMVVGFPVVTVCSVDDEAGVQRSELCVKTGRQCGSGLIFQHEVGQLDRAEESRKHNAGVYSELLGVEQTLVDNYIVDPLGLNAASQRYPEHFRATENVVISIRYASESSQIASRVGAFQLNVVVVELAALQIYVAVEHFDSVARLGWYGVEAYVAHVVELQTSHGPVTLLDAVLAVFFAGMYQNNLVESLEFDFRWTGIREVEAVLCVLFAYGEGERHCVVHGRVGVLHIVVGVDKHPINYVFVVLFPVYAHHDVGLVLSQVGVDLKNDIVFGEEIISLVTQTGGDELALLVHVEGVVDVARLDWHFALHLADNLGYNRILDFVSYVANVIRLGGSDVVGYRRTLFLVGFLCVYLRFEIAHVVEVSLHLNSRLGSALSVVVGGLVSYAPVDPLAECAGFVDCLVV